MHTDASPEHRWLLQLVGDWAYEGESQSSCGDSPDKTSGTEKVWSVGDLWVVGEGHGAMPDGKSAVTLLTIGYDPDTGKFRGTWIGSMMTHLWVYEGSLDTETNTLNLDAEGPNFATGQGTCVYRHVRVSGRHPDR